MMSVKLVSNSVICISLVYVKVSTFVPLWKPFYKRVNNFLRDFQNMEPLTDVEYHNF